MGWAILLAWWPVLLVCSVAGFFIWAGYRLFDAFCRSYADVISDPHGKGWHP